MLEIQHSPTIHGTRSQFYRAITKQDGLRGWWRLFDRGEPIIGYINEFGFGGESR